MDIKNVIYVITNKVNQKIYIGSTKKGFSWRKRKHLRDLNKNNHHNRHLQNAYNLYGEDAFSFSILEITENQDMLVEAEQKWIQNMNPEYNVMKNIKSHIGCKRSEETKRKISEALTGKVCQNLTKKA